MVVYAYFSASACCQPQHMYSAMFQASATSGDLQSAIVQQPSTSLSGNVSYLVLKIYQLDFILQQLPIATCMQHNPLNHKNAVIQSITM